MRKLERLLLAGAVVFCLVAVPGVAYADPGEGHADEIPVPPPSLPLFPPGIENMDLLDLADKDATTNSDIAFFGSYAYVGNYDGFRIIDIRDPARLQVLSDVRCRAVQSDLSVFRGREGRLYMLQSIDRPVTGPDCEAIDTPAVTEEELGPEGEPTGVTRTRARFGYEGLRLFDVTDPQNPEFLRFYRTECGSHTHTLVSGRFCDNAVFAYVASYPLGSGITPRVDHPEANRRGLNCDAPHKKISIVSMPLDDPTAGRVHKKALSSDTEP